MITPQPPTSPYRTASAGSRAGAVALRVLWASFPVWSFGLLGWVPSLRIAIRRQSGMAWGWFVGFLCGFAVEIAVAATSPTDSNNPKQHNIGPWPGLYIVVYMIVATVHAWRATRVQPYWGGYPTPPPPGPAWNGYGQGYGQPTQPSPQTVQFSSAQPPTLQSAPPQPRQSPRDSTAAEVQAELRELRGLLGESSQDER